MIEILNYEPVQNKKVTGYVDVKVTINKPTTLVFRKIAQLDSNGKKWLNFPSFSREMPDGTQKFSRYTEFLDQTHTGKFLQVVGQELEKYLEKNKSNKEQIKEFDFTQEMENPPF